MKIQFHHKRLQLKDSVDISARGGCTFAMEEVPSWLLDQLVVGDFFTKSIGMSKCSSEDVYNKKIGRDLAVSRMRKVVVTVFSNKSFPNLKQLIVFDESDNYYILEKKEGHGRVHLVSILKYY